jgi:hypothetical protein
MTRNLILSLVLVPALGALAQQPTPSAPPEGSNWQHVQALPAGASINVKTRTRSASCKLKNVDPDTLTCTQKKDIVFQRADILTIKIPRRGRSALIAGGIGAGVGAGVGAATGCSSTQQSSAWGCFLTPTRSQGAAIGAVLFGAIGGTIGAATDFSRSTVYKAQ